MDKKDERSQVEIIMNTTFENSRKIGNTILLYTEINDNKNIERVCRDKKNEQSSEKQN